MQRCCKRNKKCKNRQIAAKFKAILENQRPLDEQRMTTPRHLAAIAFSLLLGTVGSSQAEIYSWVNADGERVYSDQKPANDSDATPIESKSSVNYYNAPPAASTPPPTVHSKPKTSKSKSSSAKAANSERELSDSELQQLPPTEMTEQQCQQVYGQDCDPVVNWRKYALEACDHDSRCEDDDFLARKYQPLTLEQQLKNANRSGSRNNSQQRKIANFLRKKYTAFCAQQAAQYCIATTDSSCQQRLQSGCREPRSLKQFMMQNNLNPKEREQVIAQAKELVALKNQREIEQGIANLVEMIITPALLL